MRTCSLFDTYLSFDNIHSQWLLEFSWPLQNYLESREEISTWTEDRDESHAELSCCLLHRAITSFCVCHSSSYHECGPWAPLAWLPWPGDGITEGREMQKGHRTQAIVGSNCSRSCPSSQALGFHTILPTQNPENFLIGPKRLVSGSPPAGEADAQGNEHGKAETLQSTKRQRFPFSGPF